jgi:hypothetical protein
VNRKEERIEKREERKEKREERKRSNNCKLLLVGVRYVIIYGIL